MSIIFAIVFDPELRPKGSLGSAEPLGPERSRPKGSSRAALSPALGHEPFGSERLDLSSSTSLKAELLGPNGVNKYVIEFMNRGT
jgi:hypothetical protein